MAVYRPIAELYKQAHPLCECCPLIIPWRSAMEWQNGFSAHSHGSDSDRQPTQDIHHVRGREGLLLFDVRYYKAACRKCHDWVKDHPKEAQQLGLDQSHKR